MIRAIELSKQFPGGTVGVDKVDLSVADGEFLAIVGPSGCGKTTLLRLLAGLEDRSSGELEAPANQTMVFQSGALFPWLTALGNTVFGLKMKGIKHPESVGRKTLEEVGLGDLSKRYPRELSGGQRQRVGIARALALSPAALLLDEPFSALDTITTRSLHKDVLKIWHQNKMSIILVSHSIEEAVELADRILVMKEGQIIKEVTVDLPRPRKRGDKMFDLVEEVEKVFN